MKHFCTNCGKETSKKICEHCGVRHYDTNCFCSWCGTELDANAAICLNCQEKTKPGKFSKIGKLLGVLVAILCFFFGIAYIGDGVYVATAAAVVAGLLALPFIKSLLWKITFRKKTLRVLLNGLRIVLVVALVVTSLILYTNLSPDAENKVYKDVATDLALDVFHREVTLKNESSFVLNDSTVTVQDSYNGDDTIALVTVTLDYSAQNGFGGMNRETYIVKFLYDYETGLYSEYK